MSKFGHDLTSEFPEACALLHQLRIEGDYFRVLAQHDHVLTPGICRAEAGLEAASDERLEQVKKRRLALLDEIAASIAARRAA